MKVIFAGPTLHGYDLTSVGGIEFRPPARQGDVVQAVCEGATVIGLIDGVFEHVPAIWHKEILFGLEKGVAIAGAASMGALRAAECAAFGMLGFGRIYEDMASGLIDDDADVAQLHAPEELSYLPLSEPMANVRATASHCLTSGLISQGEHDRLLESARAIFFKERTFKRVVSEAANIDAGRRQEIVRLLRNNHVNQKLIDAKLLIARVADMPDERCKPAATFSFRENDLWRLLYPSEIDRETHIARSNLSR
jgi:hypothetical protein